MKEKILALLVAKFTGVRKDGLTQMARLYALQVATDDEAKALVDKLTKEQVDDFIREFRGDVDKEVSEGNKTFETNLKKKFDFVEKKGTSNTGDPEPPKGNEPADISAIIKAAVTDAVAPLKEELERYKASDVAKTRLQMLNEKLSTCKDEGFKAKSLKDFARMQFDTDEAFNEYLTDTEKDVADANQRYADSRLGNQGRPMFAGADATGVSTAVKQYIETTQQKAPLAGKEV